MFIRPVSNISFNNRLDSGFERVASLEQVESLFYTIERNADLMGYHCHLFLDSYRMHSQDLAFVMKGEQIHYNYYINKKI